MAKRKKFEKLQKNENYYLLHEEEAEENKSNGFLGFLKKKTDSAAEKITDTASTVPEKITPSKKFSFTKTKKVIYSDTKETSELCVPDKGPFVLILCVTALLIISSIVTSSNLFASVGRKAAAILIAIFSIINYILPIAVYILSSKKRLGLYYAKPFSPGTLPIMAVGLGLVVCLCALQKYFIAYTFSYSVPAGTTADNIFTAILIGALLPAVCEELFVHGIIQYELSSYGGGITGIFISALIFAIIHFDLQYFLIYFTAGLIFGVITHITGSVFPAMILHFLNNTLTILFSDKMVFVATERIGGNFLMIVLTALSFMFLIILLQMIEKLCIKKAIFYTNKDDIENPDGIYSSKPAISYTQFFFARQGKTPTRFINVLKDKRMLICFALFAVVVILKLI